MPELPEVETVVRGLRASILGETFADVTVRAPKASTFVSSEFGQQSFAEALAGRTIAAVERRGKNILMRLSGGVTLWVHLKMTGHFFHTPRSAPIAKHDLLIFDFQSSLAGPDSPHLRFNDYRRFGRLRLFYNSELAVQPGLADLGPEPLEISSREFVLRCQSRSRMLKPALLDQTFLAGLGNIYADESLHLALLHPRRLTSSASAGKLTELHGHIQSLLKRAIRLMGTTVDSYSAVNGRTGRFQKYLRVYNNEGNPCPNCGTTIIRETIGSRSAHYCPSCQRRR